MIIPFGFQHECEGKKSFILWTCTLAIPEALYTMNKGEGHGKTPIKWSSGIALELSSNKIMSSQFWIYCLQVWYRISVLIHATWLCKDPELNTRSEMVEELDEEKSFIDSSHGGSI